MSLSSSDAILTDYRKSVVRMCEFKGCQSTRTMYISIGWLLSTIPCIIVKNSNNTEMNVIFLKINKLICWAFYRLFFFPDLENKLPHPPKNIFVNNFPQKTFKTLYNIVTLSWKSKLWIVLRDESSYFFWGQTVLG